MAKAKNTDGVIVPPEIMMLGKSYASRYQADVLNFRTYSVWLNRFTEAAISCFTWENLPESIPEDYFEKMIFYRGNMALTRRKNNVVDVFGNTYPDFVAAPAIPEGRLDIYGNPCKVRLIAQNGDYWTRYASEHVDLKGTNAGLPPIISPADCAICWDSISRIPLFTPIDVYARKIAEIDRTFDLHTMAQRHPFVIEVDEEGQRGARAMFSQVKDGEPAIYVNRNAMANSTLNVLNMQVPYVGDKLQEDKKAIIGEAYTLLGIDNQQNDKKERVQTAEVLSNNEQIAVMRMSRLKARQQFCDRANEIFGTNISVRWAIGHEFEQMPTDASGEW